MTLAMFSPWFVTIVGAMLMLVGLYVLVRAHMSQRNDLNLSYLLVDGSLKPPRVTLAKATGLGAFLISSWIMCLYAVEMKMSTEMFSVYIVGWGAVKVMGDYTALGERKLTDAAVNDEARSILGP